MHQPVLLHEVVNYLNPFPGKRILDCTLGCGGHARAILELITPGGILIGMDEDEHLLDIAAENLKGFKEDIRLANANFRNLRKVLNDFQIGGLDGILFDLGLSSIQLEDPKRGFSIRHDGPLDMRMSRSNKIDASYLVNRLKDFELEEILRNFGEERYARRIARAIVAKRPINTTHKLARVVSKAVPPKSRYGRIHAATRTFQALRIAVNGELKALAAALALAPGVLNAGGRVAVISFHSLEDRIVKRSFRKFKDENLLKILTKRPVRPQREEILINPRSRSAKLRVAEKI